MINITSFSEFINEGFFFKDKPKSNAFLKLMKLIDELDPREITNRSNGYTFVKKFHSTNEQDPHDEEVYDDDITISIDGYGVFINRDKIPLAEKEYNLLYKAIEAKHKTQKDYERNLRIKNALDKL